MQAASGTSFVPGVGFTTLGVANGQSFALCYTESDGNDPSVDGSWVASGRAGVLAIEVAAAAGGVALSLTPAAETETAVPVGRTKRRSIVPAVETGTAVSVTVGGPVAVTLTPAVETDAGVLLTRTKHRSLTPVVETGTAVPILRTKRRTLAPAVETTAAFVIGRQKRRTIAPAAETDSVVTLIRTKQRSLLPAAEVDATAPIQQSGIVSLTLVPAVEVGVAVPLTRTKHRSITPAVEMDATVAVARTKRLAIIPAIELDEALVVLLAGLFTPALDPDALAPAAVASAFTLALTATATTNGVRMKTGDLEPDWVIEISDAGRQADLNGVVSWRLIGLRGPTLVVDDLAPTVVVNTAEPWRATVTHSWALGETASTEGFRIEGAVVATWPGGRPQTFPGHSVVHVDFEKALA